MAHRKGILGIAFFTGAILGALSASAITINSYSTQRNVRFTSGYPGGPLVFNTDPTFIGASYDWSGVGWPPSGTYSSYLSFASLTPRHILVANHYSPLKVSQPVIQFVSPSGQVTSGTVQTELGSHGTPPYAPDLSLSQFSTVIPQSAGIASYPILFQGYSPAAYAGYNLLMYGRTCTIGWNKIDAVDTGTTLFATYGSWYTPDSAYYMRYLYDAATPDRASLQSLDSNSPSFIATGSPGVMYLAGAHYLSDPGYGTGGAGFDTFLPLSLPTLNSYTSPAGYLPSVVTPTTARWTGSLSGSWTGSGNWSGGVVPQDVFNGNSQVTSCASVLFDGSATGQRSITLGAAQSVTSMAFNLAPSTTGGFTVSGSSLTIGEAGITNNDVHVQTFNNALILRTSQQWHAGSGGLAISASGSLSLGASQLLYLDGSGTSTFAGIVSGGSSGIAKDGTGTLILGNDANSFSGRIFVHNGVLQFASIRNVGGGNSALGAPTTAANGTIYLAGTLAYTGSGHSSNRVIDIADGPGAVGSTGVIDASGSGLLDLSGGVTCESGTGSSLLVLQGTGSGAQSGAITNTGSNILSLVKSGDGVWTLGGSSTYNGSTTVRGGLLSVAGSGSLAQSSAFTVSRGMLQLDDSARSNNFSSSRLGNHATGLQGGVLAVNFGNVTGGTETIGAVNATAGENTLALVAAGGNGVISGGTLGRSAGAALNFTGSLGASNRIVLSGMSSGSNFIGAGAFVNGGDYAVYDAAGYVRAMVSGTGAADYATSVTGSRHVLLTTAVVAQPSVTLATLNLSGSAAGFGLDAGQTLTLSAGGILKAGGGSATVSGGNGLSTAGEYVLRADAAGDWLAVDTALGGGTGLTKSGLGTLALGSSTNSYGGPTTINAGTLRTTVPGAIPAASPLVISGGGTLDLDGHNQTVAGITLFDGSVQSTAAAAVLTLGGTAGVTYSGAGGGSTITGGSLNLTDGTLATGHVFSVARGQGSIDLNVLANIADGSAPGQILVKSGSGILQLSGSNGYSGGTQIQAGTLTLGSHAAVPAGSSLTVAGGTLNLGGYANTAGTLTLQDGGIGGGGSLNAASINLQSGLLAGGLVGAGSLSKTTSGTVTVTGSNDHSGGTTLTGGVLVVSASNQLGNSTGPLTFNGGTLRIQGTEFAAMGRLVSSTSGGGTLDIADPNNTFTLATQNLAGGGPLVKAGQGTLQITDTNSLTNVSIVDGVLRLAGSTARFTAPPKVLLGNIALLDFTGHNETVGSLNFSGGSVNTGNGSLTLAGSIGATRSIWPSAISGNLVLGSSAGTVQADLGAGLLTIPAAISGSPTGGLVKTGAGTVVLTGSNSYTGGTTIAGGALRANDGAALPGLLTLNGGVLESSGSPTFTRAIGTGAGNVRWLSGGGGFAANGGKLTVNIAGDGHTLGRGTDFSGSLIFGSITANAETEFLNGIDARGGAVTIVATAGVGGDRTVLAGSITDSLSGGRLVKQGTGLLVLVGSMSTTGSNTVSGGTLQIGDGGTTGALANTPIQNTATLAFRRSDTYTFGGNISQYGSLIQHGPGTLVLTGTNTYTGATTIRGGALQASLTSSLPSSSNLILDGGVLESNGSMTRTTTGTGLIQWGANGGGFSANGGVLNVTIAGGGTLSWDSHIFGTLMFGSSTANDQTSFNNPINLNGADRTVNVTAGAGGDMAVLQGVLSNGTGTAGLVKTGNGLLVLARNNTYNGNTTVSSGTLQIGNGGTLGTPGATGTTINNNGVLSFRHSNNYTLSNAVSGAGSLVQIGTGNLILAGNNSYQGLTSVSSGSLQIGNGGTAGNIALSPIVNNASLIFNRSDGFAIPNNISGSGAMTIVGGSFALTGNNTYTGATNIASGTLAIGNGSAFGSIGSGAIVAGGLLALNRSNTFTLANNVSGTGGLSQIGSGKTILTGSLSNTGTTTVSGGTLQVGNGGATGNLGSGPVVNQATLALNRSGTLSLPGAVSGSGGLRQIGPGTTILGTSNSYTGTTTIGGGALRASFGPGLPAASPLVLSGGVLEGSGTASFTRPISSSGSNTVQWTSAGGGFSANGGPLTVNLFGDNRTITWTNSSGSLQGPLMFGSATANDRTDFVNPIDLNGADRTIVVTPGAGGDRAVLQGTLSNTTGTAGLIKSGDGLLVLAGTNTYNGPTTIAAGTLAVATTANLGSGGIIFSGSGGGVLNFTGTGGMSSGTLTSGTSVRLDQDGAIRQDDSALVNLIGIISGTGKLTKSGSGTLALSGTNTYSGGTVVTAGTLSVLRPWALLDGGSLTIGANAEQIFGAPLAAAMPLVGPSFSGPADELPALPSGAGAADPLFSLPGPAAAAAISSGGTQPPLNAVPEPGTLLLLLAGGGCLLWRRRRA